MGKKQIGKPYVWGAKGPNSFDCSGLVQYVFKNAVNMTLSAPTTSQETKGKSVSLNELVPGDVLFWDSKGATYHNAIYIGNNQYIHAPQPGENVKVLNMSYYQPDFARRMLKDEPKKPDLSNYYTTAAKQVVMKKNDYIYTSTGFSEKTRKKAITKNTVIPVTGIEYSTGGYPRFKVSGGYISTNKSITLKVTSNVGNYYTKKVNQIVTKKGTNMYSSVTFDDAHKVKALKKDTVVKVTGVEYSTDGYPRFKVSGGYVSTNKTIVTEVTPKIANYYTKKVNQIVTKKGTNMYSNVKFDDAHKVKALKKDTVVKVTGVEYSTDGYPRFKVSGGYVSTNKTIVTEVTPKIANYYTKKVDQIVTKKGTNMYSNVKFDDAHKVKSLKKDTVVKVTGVEYSTDGYPRFKVSGGYVSTNKTIVTEVTPKIANYYTKKVNQIVTKKGTNMYSSVTFDSAHKVKALKKDTVIKVTGVEYSSNGYPRFKVSGGYVSTNKTIVKEK